MVYPVAVFTHVNFGVRVELVAPGIAEFCSRVYYVFIHNVSLRPGIQSGSGRSFGAPLRPSLTSGWRRSWGAPGRSALTSGGFLGSLTKRSDAEKI